MKTYVNILAGGEGVRFGSSHLGLPKQFAKVGDKTLLELSLELFENCKLVNSIIIVMHPRYIYDIQDLLKKHNFTKVISIVDGGDTRFSSSFNGLEEIKRLENTVTDVQVLIHDAVRSFVTSEVIGNVIEALKRFDAVQPIVPVTETLVQKIAGHWITQNRDDFAIVQTPQGFNFNKIYTSYNRAMKTPITSWSPTDDISVIQEYMPDAVIGVVSGDYHNKKVTFPEDL